MTFDKIGPRFGGHTQKFDGMPERTGVTSADGIPMWVADMDFDAPDCVRDALRADIDRGYLGYYADTSTNTAAICRWLRERHGWEAQPEWIGFTHGVIAGFGMALDAFSEPGDNIILFTPVYHAFFGKAKAMERGVLQSPMVLRNGRYEMDLETLASQLTGKEKVLVLCSPHNPGGRLWSADEIKAVAAFCEAHDLILLSDEIHMDLTFPGVRHLPTAVAAPEALPRLVVITAASKSFNLAGLETGYWVVPDDDLRQRFDKVAKNRGGSPNRLGMIAMEAALTQGADWLDAVRDYIAANYALFTDRIRRLPGIEVMEMQSTYLAWVDFTDTGLSPEEIEARLRDRAGIAASPGPAFGQGGEHCMRFNLALPKAKLEEAILRMERVFSNS